MFCFRMPFCLNSILNLELKLLNHIKGIYIGMKLRDTNHLAITVVSHLKNDFFK